MLVKVSDIQVGDTIITPVWYQSGNIVKDVAILEDGAVCITYGNSSIEWFDSSSLVVKKNG